MVIEITDKLQFSKIRKLIGKELERLRREKEVSVEHLARQTRLKVKYVQRLEAGKGVPLFLLLRLLSFYGRNIKIELTA